jgi:hypothetical protein
MRAFLICACLALVAWTAGASPAQAKPDTSDKQVRVTADRLNVRSGPGTDNAVVASVVKGSILIELGRDGDWMNVKTPDGTLGWAAARYLQEVAPSSGESDSAAPRGKEPPAPTLDRSRDSQADSGGGAGALRTVAKWGCLVGALAAGGLSYTERNSGNDTYDEYKKLFRTQGAEAAEPKYQATEDHDGKAQTYAIVAGGLGALWVLQQFVLGRSGGQDAGSDQSDAWQPQPGRMTLETGPGSIRAGYVLARF